MVFKFTLEEDKWLEEKYEQSMGELVEFFGFAWTKNRPKIYIFPDRKTIDEYRGEKTADWVVGFGSQRLRGVCLLDRNNLETESSHEYSDGYYSRLLKHELCHLFLDILTDCYYNPKWLIEGVCGYTSGQYLTYKRIDKLDKFLGIWDKTGPGTYSESAFAIEFLVNKYGKEKILELLKRLKEKPDEARFKQIFFEIYGVNPEYNLFNSGTDEQIKSSRNTK